jgi:hypothetical protein
LLGSFFCAVIQWVAFRYGLIISTELHASGISFVLEAGTLDDKEIDFSRAGLAVVSNDRSSECLHIVNISQNQTVLLC